MVRLNSWGIEPMISPKTIIKAKDQTPNQMGLGFEGNINAIHGVEWHINI
jgi:hypothetical protein